MSAEGSKVDASALRSAAAFLASLPDDTAAEIADHSCFYRLAQGDSLVEEGDRLEAVHVVLEGELAVTKRAGETDVSLSMCQAGALVGELSLLLDIPASASVRASTASRVLSIPAADFLALLDHPGVGRHLLRVVATRLANTQAQLQQRDKMAALGTMAAGLTHELNNPAAALGRSSAQLRLMLPRWQTLTADLPDVAAAQAVSDALRPPDEQSNAGLDAIARADAEEAVGEWLQRQGVEAAWELAAHLVRAGATAERLEQALAGQPAVLAEWLAVGAGLNALVEDTAEAASRVSDIVGAVKRYSHLDEAPVQAVDLHDDLERTLRVLRHKLGTTITVQRVYAESLPPVVGDPVALNQVWTNLIDNAIDAMGGMGTLTLTTAAVGDGVEITVADDGPGIPAHVRDRIFEPFVTTKAVGSGTGLGLHLVWDVVTRAHKGDITVDSSPEGTVFRVRLPAGEIEA